MTQKPFRTNRQVTKVKAINDNAFDNSPTTAIWLANQNNFYVVFMVCKLVTSDQVMYAVLSKVMGVTELVDHNYLFCV